MRLDRHHIDPTLKDRDPDRYKKYLPEDVIELTRSEHKKIHMAIAKANNDTKKYGHPHTDEERKAIGDRFRGVPKTKEHKRKLSESNKGKQDQHGSNNPMYGKKHSEESKKKMSASSHHLKTKGSKGMHWYNNGTDNILAYDCPEGYIKGRLIIPR